MRAVADYGLAEWAKAVPLVHGLKRVRNVAIERTFRHRRAAGHARFMADLAGRQPQALAIAIAFNTPWVIDVTTRLAKLNLIGTLIVCDNSRDSGARRQIERICRERDVPYLGLPDNPVRHPSRSHAAAMNWAYYNIVDPLQPRVFGFLDHDLFAVRRFDLAARVSDQPVYGHLNASPWGWNLWAGLCIFDRAAVADFLPDFNNDFPRRLDTGGRNWMRVYRHLDITQIKFSTRTIEWIYPPEGTRPLPMEMIDDCLHGSGAAYADHELSIRQEQVMESVIRHLEGGGALVDLIGPAPKSQVA